MDIRIDEIELDKLVDFVFRRLRDGSWLYWPPGPMTGQVFDKSKCKEELRRFLETL